MACEKCGYIDKNEKEILGKKFCLVCAKFAPTDDELKLNKFAEEKIDWKLLETFRKFGCSTNNNLKKGMEDSAKKGKLVARPPLGYEVLDGKLIPNEKSSKVHSLFTIFLNKNYSLNSLSKNYSLSLNGLKKILSNRTYLGEIKFNNQIHKGNHQAIISPEIFYAVQRKLKEKLRS